MIIVAVLALWKVYYGKVNNSKFYDGNRNSNNSNIIVYGSSKVAGRFCNSPSIAIIVIIIIGLALW